MKVITRSLAAVVLLLFSIAQVLAAEPINTLERSGLFGYDPSGVAIRGFDTVAYFSDGRAVRGNDQYTTDWMGATWKFASQEHLDLFAENPERYAPQFGGYCAYGIAAQDALVKIEGKNWTIHNDKLYLNYNDDLQARWQKNIAGYVAEAERKFDTLLTTE